MLYSDYSPEFISPKNNASFDHHLPVSFGAKVGMNIYSGLSIESGLVYSYLHSSYTLNNAVKGKQNLYYLGIPLNLTYEIAHWKALSFYTSAGGRVDFNLKGKQKSFVASDEYNYSFRDKKPVWSLRANVGVAFKIFNWLQIYGEPGIARYFYDGKVENYWKEHKVLFDRTSVV